MYYKNCRHKSLDPVSKSLDLVLQTIGLGITRRSFRFSTILKIIFRKTNLEANENIAICLIQTEYINTYIDFKKIEM